MKTKSTVILLLVITFTMRVICYAEVGTTAGFIAELNSKWVAADYLGIKNVINSRLTLKGNQDLPGLMAKCDYYALFEYDLNVLQTASAQAKQVKATLNWNSDKEALGILDAGIQAYENPQQAQAQGFIFGLSAQQIQALRTEYPSQYPSAQLIQRFGSIQYP
jgi:hypothetical protein